MVLGKSLHGGGLGKSNGFGVITPKGAKVRQTRGRPESFDRQAVIEEAMKLFWDRGYEGTSFADLIAAMGVSASSAMTTSAAKEITAIWMARNRLMYS